jgi:CubicO group peptidase (beta-lactamase class C family)
VPNATDPPTDAAAPAGEGHAVVQAAVAELVADQCDAGRHLGVQVHARLAGRTVVDVAAGWLDPGRRRPVRRDSLFCCFSVTKAVAATVVWRLLAEGRLAVDRPVADVWPGFMAATTVGELLSHQAGLHRVPPDLDTAFLTGDRAGLAWVAGLEPAWPPGSASGYHTLTYGWLVRGLVEAVTGRPFPRVMAPDLFVGLPADETGRAAEVVEAASARGLAWVADRDHPALEAMPPSFVPDWNDPAVRGACQPAFSGWASASALATYVDGLAPAVFEPAIVPLVTGVDRCLELPVRRGLGVELGGRFDGGAVGALGPRERAFGHGGHGGQVVVRDPDAELTIAVLVNLLAEPEEAADRTTTICELIRGLCDAY